MTMGEEGRTFSDEVMSQEIENHDGWSFSISVKMHFCPKKVHYYIQIFCWTEISITFSTIWIPKLMKLENWSFSSPHMCSLFKKQKVVINTQSTRWIVRMQSLKDKGKWNSVSVEKKSGGLSLSGADEKDTKSWTQADRGKNTHTQDKCDYTREGIQACSQRKGIRRNFEFETFSRPFARIHKKKRTGKDSSHLPMPLWRWVPPKRKKTAQRDGKKK